MSADDRVHVGFLGLGNMGWPMARNLSRAGHRLTVRDVDAERQRRFAAEHDCLEARTPAAFAGTAVVVTMLPDDRVVWQAVVDWEGGLAAALAPRAVVVDMSSSNPLGTRRLGDELARHGVALVDAPVSGGVTRAADGTLSIMIGGDDEDAIARAEPVLRVLGGRLFRTGPLGSGHAMKALNNYVGAAAYLTAAEALAVGQHYGLDVDVMLDVMNSSTGRSFNTEHVLKEDVVTGRYGTGFALGLMAKDVGIAASLAEASGVDAPACRLVSRRWSEALEGLGPGADHSTAHRRWWTVDLAARRRAEAE
jgi:3-hydroxyisobutyrate dehydrogenase